MTQLAISTEPSASSSSAELEAKLCPSAMVVPLLPRLMPLLEAAVPRGAGRLSPEKVLTDAIHGRVQLWLVGAEGEGIVGVLATELIVFPTGRRVCVAFVWSGVSPRKAMHLLSGVLEPWAREQGCHEVQITGGRGWGRLCRDYSEAFRTFTKEL